MISIEHIKYTAIFIYGICIGSFINVIVYRIPREISVLKGHSFCPNCGLKIKKYDLFPIISFLFLKGRCRICNKKIAIKYPLIELFTGLVAMFTFYINGFVLESILIFAIISILIAISIIDIDTFIIPSELVYLMIPLISLLMFMQPDILFYERIVGFFIISVPMIFSRKLVLNSFGGGDIRLIAICGFMLGFKKVLLAMFIAIITAGVYSSYLLISKKCNKKEHIAFGPYLSLGIYISLLKGTEIINFYYELYNFK